MHRFPHVICGLLGAVMATAAACAPLTVTSTIERGAELSRYRTYGWDQVDTAVPGDPRLDDNPFFHEYMRASIDRQLVSRGYEPIIMDPDMRVHYHASAVQKVHVSGSEPPAPFCRDCSVQVYDEGTLVIDLVDARTGLLVWRGAARGDFAAVVDSQTRMEQTIERVVERIVGRLPRGG